MDGDTKKYINMENVLNAINKKYISLPEDEKRRNSIILEQATEKITALMKEKDALFKNMYERKFYGGSYYDGIKVGKPEEYDLDYVLNIPLIVEPVLEASNKPGFMYLQIKEYSKLLKRDEASKFDKLNTLMDAQNYLSTSKVLQWIEGTINLAFNGLQKVPDKGHRLEVKLSENETITVYAFLSKAGPAFTLKIKDEDGLLNLDIDLVPCFQFTSEKWPKKGYRSNPVPSKNKFLIVPKKPHEMVSAPKDLERYWRLSFQEQERELIKGHHFKSLKPTIKMLKQLRDKQNHVQIASYYIKTIFLWEAKNQSENFWKMPWSYVTIMMLKKYANMIQAKSIPYYWNEHYNLISHLKDITITGIGNTLKNIVADVEKNSEDPFVFCKYLISTEEVDILRIEVDLGKKHIRKLKIMECLDISTSSSTTDSVISASQMSDDERIRRLILDDDFLREVAEHMSKYLKNYRSEQPSNSCSKDGLNDQSRTVKPHCQSNVPDLNTVSVLVGTCNMLNQRVSLLENGFRKLLVENDRLRDEINKMTASNVD